MHKSPETLTNMEIPDGMYSGSFHLYGGEMQIKSDDEEDAWVTEGAQTQTVQVVHLTEQDEEITGQIFDPVSRTLFSPGQQVWRIQHGGGYITMTQESVEFINDIPEGTHIALTPVESEA